MASPDNPGYRDDEWYRQHGGWQRRTDRPAWHPDDCDCFDCWRVWMPRSDTAPMPPDNTPHGS